MSQSNGPHFFLPLQNGPRRGLYPFSPRAALTGPSFPHRTETARSVQREFGGLVLHGSRIFFPPHRCLFFLSLTGPLLNSDAGVSDLPPCHAPLFLFTTARSFSRRGAPFNGVRSIFLFFPAAPSLKVSILSFVLIHFSPKGQPRYADNMTPREPRPHPAFRFTLFSGSASRTSTSFVRVFSGVLRRLDMTQLSFLAAMLPRHSLPK